MCDQSGHQVILAISNGNFVIICDYILDYILDLISPETPLELLGILLHDRFCLGHGTLCDGGTRALTSKIGNTWPDRDGACMLGWIPARWSLIDGSVGDIIKYKMAAK